MDYMQLAGLLFPDVTRTTQDLEQQYPPRQLPEGAKVTRMAPSPTGFMHLGNLFGAITDERLAHQSKGVFLFAYRRHRRQAGSTRRGYKPSWMFFPPTVCPLMKALP